MGTKNVLIIDLNEAMQQLRARVLRSRGVHVHTAKSVTEAELLWVPDSFDLALLDVRQRSKEAAEFWRTIRRQHPSQRISFLVGPQRTCLPPAPTKSSPAMRFLKTGCRGQESCMPHKDLTEDWQPDGNDKSRRKIHENGAFDQDRCNYHDSSGQRARSRL